MQAIHVKFLCPTNVRGSRYKATAQAGSVTVHSDHALNPEQNAIRAARALACKYGWAGEFVIGGLPDGSYACVFTAGASNLQAGEDTAAFHEFAANVRKSLKA